MSKPQVSQPATSTTGFFQPTPVVENQWLEDAALRRASALFVPAPVLNKVSPALSKLGAEVLTPEILNHVTNAEKNPPYIDGDGYNSFGVPKDSAALVTSPGWKALQDFGLENGVVATGYQKDLAGSARVVQVIKIHLWGASSAMVVCPSGMQDGATSVLIAELSRPPPSSLPYEMVDTRTRVFKKALSHLLDTDPKNAWTSGQWMTERRGGSDVSGTETFASWVGLDSRVDADGLPLGPYSISGFKWFSSATDCGCALVLAWTAKGLSCFFAPTRVQGGAMNGIKIQRLKNKLGTKALPTAELEIKGMRAWLVGEEGRGVSVIATVLNVTRFHNAARGVGFLGRGLGIARAFSRVRTFPKTGAALKTIPLFNKTLATTTLRYRADTLLTFFLAALLGSVQAQAPNPLVPEGQDAELLLRILTSVAKAYTTKHGIHGLQECMEALGGVGYLENFETPEINVARIFRDANVFSIWEGTTDVLATDTVKCLTGRQGKDVTAALDRWINSTLDSVRGFDGEKREIRQQWEQFKALPKEKEELLSLSRLVYHSLGDIVCSVLLLADANRDGDEVAAECARRFVAGTLRSEKRGKGDWKEVSKWDHRIAFDGEAQQSAKL